MCHLSSGRCTIASVSVECLLSQLNGCGTREPSHPWTGRCRPAPVHCASLCHCFFAPHEDSGSQLASDGLLTLPLVSEAAPASVPGRILSQSLNHACDLCSTVMHRRLKTRLTLASWCPSPQSSPHRAERKQVWAIRGLQPTPTPLSSAHADIATSGWRCHSRLLGELQPTLSHWQPALSPAGSLASRLSLNRSHLCRQWTQNYTSRRF